MRGTAIGRLLLALLAAALAVPACGNDDGSAGGAPGAADFLASGCRDAIEGFIEVQTRFSEAAAASFSGEDADFAVAAEQVQALVAAAPEEIRGEFEVLEDELVPYFEALAELDVGSGGSASADDVARVAALSDDLDQEALRQASQNIELWFEEECGVG